MLLPRSSIVFFPLDDTVDVINLEVTKRLEQNVLQIPSRCTKLDYKCQKSVSVSGFRIIVNNSFHAAKI